MSPSPTQITEVTITPLDIALRAPFGIAGGAQEVANNLLVRVGLAGGAVGLGEAAPLPAFSGETQAVAWAALREIKDGLLDFDARALRPLSRWLWERVPGSPSAVCAVETAVLDALCRHHRLPLWVYFGGAGTRLWSDMTITTGTVAAARAAAAEIRDAGFSLIKLKVGGCPIAEDEERIAAVVAAAPEAELLLDGNGGLSGVDQALALLAAARQAGGRVGIFEQPLPRADLAGLRELSRRGGVAVAADESAASVADLLQVSRAEAAQVINIKIMKSGIIESIDMIAVARALGLGLMIGGMVESELAMSTSACLAAGQGGFLVVDLDTPLFLIDSPLSAQARRQGPLIDLQDIAAGHGVALAGQAPPG